MRIALILTAAGNSMRMNSSIKKEFISLSKHNTVLSQASLEFFNYFKTQKEDSLCHCIVTLPKNQIYQGMNSFFNEESVNSCIDLNLSPVFIEGGNSRQESVFKGLLKLETLQPQADIVLIHDAARPFVSKKIIQDIIQGAKLHGASVPVIPSIDTQKQLDSKKEFIFSHLKRDELVSVQTPQAFLFNDILLAHKKAANTEKNYTDDSEIYGEFTQKAIFVVDGNIENKKITYQNDLPKDLKLDIYKREEDD